uniref:Uncharacterized protein n=1 Tax=Physcomitrium patens TaxID=3218 RepID=A0A2K1JLT0_PHYPA|nr:hypothetical protein PHYPA_017333 [Physcomitrium patens]
MKNHFHRVLNSEPPALCRDSLANRGANLDYLEMRGIIPRTSRMLSEHSTI